MLSYIKSSIIKLYNSEKHVNITDTLPYNSISFSGGGAGISGIILCYENQHNKMQVLSNIIHEIIEMVTSNIPSYKQVEYYYYIEIHNRRIV